jgi:hypothetical protein
MVVRRVIALLLLIAVIGPPLTCWSQAPRSKYDPAASGPPPSPHRDGFVAFTLKRINPSDTDYGEIVGHERSLIAVQTIENAYFWSNIAALGLLGCLFIVVVYQQLRLNRTAWRSADVLAQFEHALVRSNRQIQDCQQVNQDLIDSLSASREAGSRVAGTISDQPSDREPGVRSRSSSTQKRNTAAPTVADANPSNGARKAAAAPPNAVAQIGLFNNDRDLVMKVNSQEQQISAMQEQMNLLRRQLADSERKLKAEQEKNRAPKAS